MKEGESSLSARTPTHFNLDPANESLRKNFELPSSKGEKKGSN